MSQVSSANHLADSLQVDDEESDEDARPRQRNRSDSDGEVPNGVSDEEVDEDEHSSVSADFQMAKKLVRYAIACESSRTAIRRDGIKERGENCANGSQ